MFGDTDQNISDEKISSAPNAFNNAGSGITFGNADIGASYLEPSATSTASATRDGTAANSTGGGAGTGSTFLGLPVMDWVIGGVIVAGLGVGIYVLIKKT